MEGPATKKRAAPYFVDQRKKAPGYRIICKIARIEACDTPGITLETDETIGAVTCGHKISLAPGEATTLTLPEMGDHFRVKTTAKCAVSMVLL